MENKSDEASIVRGALAFMACRMEAGDISPLIEMSERIRAVLEVKRKSEEETKGTDR